MTITASKLRENIYQLLDWIIKTGQAIEMTRKGKKLRISLVEPPGKLTNLKERDVMVCDPDSLVHLDWSKEWKPKLK